MRQNIDRLTKMLAETMHVQTESKPFLLSMALYLCKWRGHQIVPKKEVWATNEDNPHIYWRDKYDIIAYFDENGKEITRRFSFRPFSENYSSSKPVLHTEVVFERYDINGIYLDFPISTLRVAEGDYSEPANIGLHRLLWEMSKDTKFLYSFPEIRYDFALSNIFLEMGDVYGPKAGDTVYHFEMEGEYGFLNECEVVGIVSDRNAITGSLKYRLRAKNTEKAHFDILNFSSPKIEQIEPKFGTRLIDEFDLLFSERSVIYRMFEYYSKKNDSTIPI